MKRMKAAYVIQYTKTGNETDNSWQITNQNEGSRFH